MADDRAQEHVGPMIRDALQRTTGAYGEAERAAGADPSEENVAKVAEARSNLDDVLRVVDRVLEGDWAGATGLIGEQLSEGE